MRRATAGALAIALVGLAVIGALAGGAAAAEVGNESVEFDNTSNLTVTVAWNDSAATNATADVDVYDAGAFDVDGADVTDDALNSTTLDGTTAEFDTANVTDATTYDVELDQSNTTVTISTSDLENGSVDLSAHTDTAITADDTILSVTATAETVAVDSLDADPGNETDVEFTEDDGLEDGEEYRVLVDGPEGDVDDVEIDDGSGGWFVGIGGSDDGGGVFVGVLVIAAVLVAAVIVVVKGGGR